MTADEFLERAGPLLLADEARHNLILGIAGAADHYPEARFWIVDGAAALRTPPYNLVLATPRDHEALRALVAAIDDDVPGVTGTAPEVYAFAEPWGKPWRVVHENNVFELAAVVPASAHDAYREARDDDTELLLDWWEAFVREALPHEEVDPRERRSARRPRGSGEPDVECDLRADRLPQGRGGRCDRVRVTPKRAERHRPVRAAEAEEEAQHAHVIGFAADDLNPLFSRTASGASWPRPCRP